MLRITVHDNAQVLTFQLEGELAGPWLRVLEECWQSTLAHQRKPIVRVDLTGVTFIGDAGKACLAAMHREHAEFVVADCLTKEVVAEILQGRFENPSKNPFSAPPSEAVGLSARKVSTQQDCFASSRNLRG